MAPDRSLRNKGMVQLEADPAVLFWQGGGDPHAPGERFFPGIPARDLSEHDIARVIYTQTVARVDENDAALGPLKPGDDGFDDHHQNLVDLLKASALYGTKPKEAPPTGESDQTAATPVSKE